MFKKYCISLLVLPVFAQAETVFTLANGQYDIVMDESIATYTIHNPAWPGHCQPELRVTTQSYTQILIEADKQTCQHEPVAEIKLNPAWQAAFAFQMAAGQIEVASSLIQRFGKIQAKVGVGEISGLPGIQTNWLMGAELAHQNQDATTQLRIHVDYGQIHFHTKSRQ